MWTLYDYPIKVLRSFVLGKVIGKHFVENQAINDDAWCLKEKIKHGSDK